MSKIKWLEFRVDKPCVHDSDIYIDCPLCRITELEATIERVRGLLFGTDEPLTQPVNIDMLNELFRNLRKALGDME